MKMACWVDRVNAHSPSGLGDPTYRHARVKIGITWYEQCIDMIAAHTYDYCMPTSKQQRGAPLVRTSIQLPQALLDDLERRWPSATLSQRIRMAIERHEFVMQVIQRGTTTILDEHLAAVSDALRDFELPDFKIACRAMPSLLEAFFIEEPHTLTEAQVSSTVDWIQETETRERLHILDAVVRSRSADTERVDAGPSSAQR
jgi:hypothetical protein